MFVSAFQAEKVHELNEEIGKLLAKAEQLGAEGNVDEAQKVLQEVEKVRTRKKDAEVSEGQFEKRTLFMEDFPSWSGRLHHLMCSLVVCLFVPLFPPSHTHTQEEYRNSMPASSFQQQKLRVCEVCSAYLGLHDNDRRLADHFGGKLHLGFIQIREKLDQLKVRLAAFSRTLAIFVGVFQSDWDRMCEHGWLLVQMGLAFVLIRKRWWTSRRRGTRIASKDEKKGRKRKE